MPTTRSRALKSINASAPEPPLAAQTILPLPADGKKRKRSRREPENVASTDLNSENDAKVSAVTGVSAKKHKGSDKNPSQRKPLAKKSDMPPPSLPVTIKVVTPTPPEVSQKAMRSVGSVIARFDPWKMRDSTTGQFHDELDDSEEPIDDATMYDPSASTPDALQEDEPTAVGDAVSDSDLDMPHRVGGTDARQEKVVQGTADQDDEILDETSTRLMDSGSDGLRSVKGILVDNDPVTIRDSGAEDDDEGKQDFSISASGGPPGLIVTGRRTDMISVPPIAEDENDPEHGSERDVDRQERDAEATIKAPHVPAFSGGQIAESSDNNAPFVDSLFNAEPLVFIQARLQSLGASNAQPNDDTDAASSTYSEDAEGDFDEELHGGVQPNWSGIQATEKRTNDAGTDEEDYSGTSPQDPVDDGDDVFKDYAEALAHAAASQKPEVAGEAIHPAEFDKFSVIAEVERERRATGGALDADIGDVARKDDYESLKHVKAVEAQGGEELAPDPEGNADQASSVGDRIGAITPSLDCHLDKETEERDESSANGLKDFLGYDDAEQAAPEHDEAALKDHRMIDESAREGGADFSGAQGLDTTPTPTKFNEYHEVIVVPETDLDALWYSNEQTEAMDEDQLSSLFGSSPEPDGPDDRDTRGESRDIASLTSNEEVEHDDGVPFEYPAEILDEHVRTSLQASQNDHVSTNDCAEREGEKVGQLPQNVASVLEGETWRSMVGSADMQDSAITNRLALLPADIAASQAPPQDEDGILNGLQSAPTTCIKERNEIMREIHGTLTRILDIQLKESIENAKFREFVMTRQGETPS